MRPYKGGSCVCVQDSIPNLWVGEDERTETTARGRVCTKTHSSSFRSSVLTLLLLLLYGATLHTHTSTDRDVCVQSVGTVEVAG